MGEYEGAGVGDVTSESGEYDDDIAAEFVAPADPVSHQPQPHYEYYDLIRFLDGTQIEAGVVLITTEIHGVLGAAFALTDEDGVRYDYFSPSAAIMWVGRERRHAAEETGHAEGDVPRSEPGDRAEAVGDVGGEGLGDEDG